MFNLTEQHRYWLYNEPTDMRKSFHSLSGIVQAKMQRRLTPNDVYIFINKHRNRIKLLHYEPGGLVLYSKILDQGRMKELQAGADGDVKWSTLLQAIEASFNNPTARRREFAIKQKMCSHCIKNIAENPAHSCVYP